jgi:hypothetical protein
MLIYILRRVLGGSLLLSCVVILGYCVKQLGNWILNTVKARGTVLSEEVVLEVNTIKLVYYIQLECCYSTARVAAARVLPKGYWVVGAIKLGVRYLVKKLY